MPTHHRPDGIPGLLSNKQEAHWQIIGLGVLAIIVLVIIGLSAFFAPASSQVGSGEIVVQYALFEGHPLSMVIERNKHVSLRISRDLYEAIVYDTTALNILKREVIRFVSSEDGAVLGKTGRTFYFQGRCPIWAPYVSISDGKAYQVLYFADHGMIVENGFRGEGRSERPSFYPYPFCQ